jgi:ankyrin repeat protein
MAAARPVPAARAEAEHDGRLRERSSANAAAGAAAPAAKALQAAPGQTTNTLGSANANPNAMLQRAAEAGQLDGVKQALAAGANQQAINAALHAAAERGHLEVLRTVLAAGADVGSLNRYGGTVLIPASHYGHVAIVRELLQTTRIDRNHVNNLGWTALLEAVLLGDGDAAHTEIVKLLLAHGADPNIADRAGVTPLQHARQRGYTAMARAIEAAGGR